MTGKAGYDHNLWRCPGFCQLLVASMCSRKWVVGDAWPDGADQKVSCNGKATSLCEGVTNLPVPLANTRRPWGRRVFYCLWGRFVPGVFQAGQELFDRIDVEIGQGEGILPQ